MTTVDLARLHRQLIETRPLVQNITNTVVQQFSANVLLAMSASPAMLDHEADAGQFAKAADALLVNFGTASNQQLLAADAAIAVVEASDKPWVLDPVSVGVVDYRTSRIRQAADHHPSVVRGNASEIAALAGVGHGGRGVDSVDEVEAVLPAAVRLARFTGGVVAVSGAQDVIVRVADDVCIARVDGGHPLMARVVGTGCALGSAVAAYLGAQRGGEKDRLADHFDATIAAHAHFALAGQVAGQHAHAPGSFAVAFMDALFRLRDEDFERAQVTIQTYPLARFDVMSA